MPWHPSFVYTDDSMGLSVQKRAYLRDLERVGLGDSEEDDGYNNDDEGSTIDKDGRDS